MRILVEGGCASTVKAVAHKQISASMHLQLSNTRLGDVITGFLPRNLVSWIARRHVANESFGSLLC